MPGCPRRAWREGGKGMKKKPAFKKRYVISVGYPWAFGLKPYKTIGMTPKPYMVYAKSLRFPVELWSREVPKYRLVLEIVEGKPKKGAK
jgi:hypothetical protein